MKIKELIAYAQTLDPEAEVDIGWEQYVGGEYDTGYSEDYQASACVLGYTTNKKGGAPKLTIYSTYYPSAPEGLLISRYPA